MIALSIKIGIIGRQFVEHQFDLFRILFGQDVIDIVLKRIVAHRNQCIGKTPYDELPFLFQIDSVITLDKRYQTFKVLIT